METHDITARRTLFREMHREGCFVIPNPWDRGSARHLARLGFRALATTSAGLAFSLGLPDTPTALSREVVLAHLRDLVEATPLPVSADFQAGHGSDPEGVAESVCLCLETGVAGLSIADASDDPGRPLYELSVATDRVRAAVEAAAGRVVVTARAECHLVGHPDPLRESIRRLRAYAGAGADVLYAPGLRDRDSIRAVVEAVAPRPVNVLVGHDIGLGLADLAELGVRRVSVGSALARVAWTSFLEAAPDIAEGGEFGSFAGIATTGQLSALLEQPRR